MYALLKHSHLFIIALSFLIFFVRGVLMMRSSVLYQHKFFKIAPHILYTFLIGTGLGLAVHLHLSPGNEPWLLTKIIALIVFIIVSVFAFKHNNATVRKILWLIGLVILIFIVSVAFSKNVLGFLA
jgi:uncharacterized membrane protein SirB2